jgi:hypothetical protein
MIVISKNLSGPAAMFYDIPMVVHSEFESGEDQHKLASTWAMTGSEFVSCTHQKCCQTGVKFTSSIHIVSSKHASNRAQSGNTNSMAIFCPSGCARGKLNSNLLRIWLTPA